MSCRYQMDIESVSAQSARYPRYFQVLISLRTYGRAVVWSCQLLQVSSAARELGLRLHFQLANCLDYELFTGTEPYHNLETTCTLCINYVNAAIACLLSTFRCILPVCHNQLMP